MSTPSVTIITGYYKRADVVARTLQSLLDQTCKDTEIIVFDDASPDGTADAIRAFVEAANDPRLVTIYHEKNIGFVRGLIDAISRAKGAYIAIQGSGDIALPARIEKQKAIMDAQADIGVVGCHYENVVEASGIERLRTPDANDTDLESLLRQNVFTHGEVMFRKSFYDQVGGYRPQFVFCQDYDLWLRMIRVCRFATVPELLYRRFVDFEGVSYKPDKFIAQTRFTIIAQRLCAFTLAEQETQLGAISRETLADHVPLEASSLQKSLWRATLRAIIWGNFSLAQELVKNYVASRPVGALLLSASWITQHIPLVHRFLILATGSKVK